MVSEPHIPFPVPPSPFTGESWDLSDLYFMMWALICAISPNGLKEHPVGEGTVPNGHSGSEVRLPVFKSHPHHLFVG